MLVLTPSSRRVAPAGVVVAARTVPPAVAAVAALAVLPSLVVAATGGHAFGGALLAASLFAGVGAGYAVDDAAAVTLAPSPTTLARRRALRAVSVVAVLVAAWLAALLAAAVASGGAGLPSVGELAAELAAAAAVSTALASRVRPDAPAAPGFGAATGALLTMVLIGSLAPRFTFLPALGGGLHHDRWWWLAAAAAGAAAWAWRDPAARPLLRRHAWATGARVLPAGPAGTTKRAETGGSQCRNRLGTRSGRGSTGT